MFRHTQTPNAEVNEINTGAVAAPTTVLPNKISPAPLSDAASLKELVEKNLKWSQIIYEQNRKINNKLMWMAIASWLKILIILIPLVLAIFFLPPLLKDVWSQYGQLLGVGASESSGLQPKSFDSVINLLNLDPAKQEQLKALLK